jgi:hypothetical protein
LNTYLIDGLISIYFGDVKYTREIYEREIAEAYNGEHCIVVYIIRLHRPVFIERQWAVTRKRLHKVGNKINVTTGKSASHICAITLKEQVNLELS